MYINSASRLFIHSLRAELKDKLNLQLQNNNNYTPNTKLDN